MDTLFPRHVKYPFVQRHIELWDWMWGLEPGVRPVPFVGIWSRGGAKSTSIELGLVAIAARQRRRYGLYVCGTQEQADKHVQSVASLFESSALELRYPLVGSRGVNKYGSSKGWRRSQLRTASGFTLDAIGLDVAARGFKVDDARPDVIILDDIDGRHDSETVTARKTETLADSILPTGSADVAIVFVQNRVNATSIASSFIERTNKFLIDHRLSGPYPAVEGLAYKSVDLPDGRKYFRITAGRATWEGQNLETCERQLNDWGPDAFLAEAQHEKRDQPGGLFSDVEYRHIHEVDLPEFIKSTVWVDPAVSNTDESDCHAVSGASLGADGLVYVRSAWEGRTDPEDALRRAILLAIAISSPSVGVETDQGGDTWISVYARALEALVAEYAERGEVLPYYPRFRAAKAGSFGSKVHRATQMLLDYQRGEIVHVVGPHGILERALYRFPKVKPFDLVDASFWSWADLRDMVPDEDDGFLGMIGQGTARGAWTGA